MTREIVFPTTRQFPFDEVVETILYALKGRDWKAPGIKVKFDDLRFGKKRGPKVVRSIQGRDFHLHFTRPEDVQSRSPQIAVSCLTIPKKELRVFEDEGGPRLYVYVGDDWESDREQFLADGFVKSKAYGEKRWYLMYSGVRAARGVRTTLLRHDDDLGRQYGLEPGDPAQYAVGDVFAEFTKWLSNNVLTPLVRRR